MEAEDRVSYKKTKLGLIPKDWNYYRLEQILKSAKLGGNYKNTEDSNSNPLIKMGNIGRGVIQLNKIEYILETELISNDDLLQKGDILFNTRNTLDLVGKVAIWNNDLPKAYYNSNLLRFTFDKKLVASNYYMNYLFNSYSIIRQLRGIATGTTSVAAIYSRDLYKVKIPLPSIPEQQKIAKILSTWDQAIEQSQKLIEQLKLRKKGLMQQLLTGKTRLPGFSGEWKTNQLDFYMSPISRPIPKPKSNFLALGLRSHGKGIFHKENFDPDAIMMDTLYKVKEDDLVVNITFAWEQAIAVADEKDEGGLVSHRFPTFTFKKEKAFPLFFRYFVLQPYFKYLLDLISPGGAGRNRVMSKKDFPKLQVRIPNLNEQQAIAKVLTAADSEIKSQENYLQQLQLQKKGLMQQLLTGKKRVKID
jgi:type I restriction enzyme S subunit